MRTVCCGSFMKFAVCCVPRGVRLSLGQCKIDQDFKLKVTW